MTEIIMEYNILNNSLDYNINDIHFVFCDNSSPPRFFPMLTK